MQIFRTSSTIRRLLAVAAAAALLLAFSTSAVATPPGGLSAEVLVAANVVDPTQVKLKESGGFGDPRDVDQIVTARFEVSAGGTFGWHRHPGPVVVAISEGTLTVTTAGGCATRTYGPGEGFIESGRVAHIAVNQGSSPVILYATFLLPDHAAPLVDEPVAC